MDVSICVATYRRPAGLARLCASLGRMKLPPGLRIELIVVDNDPAASETASLPDAGGLPARRLREPERNIARARNAAVAAARGTWLAFVDDDEEVDEMWLAAYLAQAERTPCDGLFGPVQPRLERPDASGTEQLAWFASRQRHAGVRVPPEAMLTGNAFLRRHLFEGAAFDPALGRSGGEDTELFGRLCARGADFRWCVEARVDEWIPPERLRAGWLLRRAWRGGNVHGRLARRGSRAQALRGALRATAGLVVELARLPLGILEGRAGRLRAAMRFATACGRIAGVCGHVYEEYRG
ncbi:MAG TPA: glycosyltransferase [Myxococcota bacterium]|nr:glycosyltransferase [Myxococcota bacterium]